MSTQVLSVQCQFQAHALKRSIVETVKGRRSDPAAFSMADDNVATWGGKWTLPKLLLPKLVFQDLVHDRGIGLALHGLHGLPHKETEQLIFPAAIFCNLVGIVG